MAQPVQEALKELARVVIFGIIGLGIAYFANLPQNQTTVIVLLALRGIDKFVHESPTIKAGGIVPF